MGHIEFNPTQCVWPVCQWRRSGPFPFLCDDGRVVNLYGPHEWRVIESSPPAGERGEPWTGGDNPPHGDRRGGKGVGMAKKKMTRRPATQAKGKVVKPVKAWACMDEEDEELCVRDIRRCRPVAAIWNIPVIIADSRYYKVVPRGNAAKGGRKK